MGNRAADSYYPSQHGIQWPSSPPPYRSLPQSLPQPPLSPQRPRVIPTSSVMMAGSETRMVGWSGGDSRDWHTEGALACSDRLTGRPPGPQQPLQASSEASGAWGRGKNLGASLLESRVAARLRSAQVALTHSLKRASCVLENKVCVFGAFLGRPSRQSAGRAPERPSRGQREWMLLVTGHGSALVEVHFEVFLRSSDLQKATERIGWEAPRTVHNDQLSSPN